MKKKKSQLSIIWKRLKKNRLAMLGLFIIFILFLVAVFAKYLMPYPYDLQNYDAILADSSPEHLLGTDELGRDILSRLIYGTRLSLSIGLSTVLVGLVLGGFLGCIAGFYGGTVDNLIMRFLDIYQSVPWMIFAIALASVLKPGTQSTIFALGIATMQAYARLIRASILQIRSMEYIEAARAIDGKDYQILLTHILPNSLSPMIVFVSMSIGASILSVASLSFIGLGPQPPLPEWGAMLSSGRNLMRDHPTLVLYPGIMIMISVLAFNLLGDGLRDALDPRLKN